MTVIESSSSSARTMADGTLRLTVDIEPRHSQAAFALFGAPGTPMALAAIKCATAAPAPAKGGELAKWVAIRCHETGFQQWLILTFGECANSEAAATPKHAAAAIIYRVCGIKSRADLDNDDAAAKRFHALIRKPFEAAA